MTTSSASSFGDPCELHIPAPSPRRPGEARRANAADSRREARSRVIDRLTTTQLAFGK
jgi:hypothetical protein